MKGDINTIIFILERVKFNSLKRLDPRVTPMKSEFHSFTLRDNKIMSELDEPQMLQFILFLDRSAIALHIYVIDLYNNWVTKRVTL